MRDQSINNAPESVKWRHRPENQELLRAAQRRRAEKNREKYADFMKNRRCERCGLPPEETRRLNWHHKDPSTKRFNISTAGCLRAWESMFEEIEKCELLCLDCHWAEHKKINARTRAEAVIRDAA